MLRTALYLQYDKLISSTSYNYKHRVRFNHIFKVFPSCVYRTNELRPALETLYPVGRIQSCWLVSEIISSSECTLKHFYTLYTGNEFNFVLCSDAQAINMQCDHMWYICYEQEFATRFVLARTKMVDVSRAKILTNCSALENGQKSPQ